MKTENKKDAKEKQEIEQLKLQQKTLEDKIA
jgi:hypothetical protein